jgi:hypothetical protein
MGGEQGKPNHASDSYRRQRSLSHANLQSVHLILSGGSSMQAHARFPVAGAIPHHTKANELDLRRFGERNNPA